MTEPVRDPCLQCGPGYCIGDEGCRHRPSPVVSVTEPAETAEALRELSEAATPGPWEARGDDLGMPGDMVALTTWREVTADAAFIAAAVNYVRALLAAAPVPAVPAEPGAEMQHPRQRKGVNPFLTRSTEQVAEALDSWAADQRQRETWRDGDTNTYRYRANLLEAAAVRLRAAAPVPAVPAEPGEVT